MTSKFKMSMMGELKFFLGFEIKQRREGTFINQAKYTQDMLKRFKLSDVKLASTPMPTKCQIDMIPMVKRWIKRYIVLWLAPCFTFVHLDRISCWVWEFVHSFKPHLRKATMWRSSESFDIWLIPQNLAYGTLEEQTSISQVFRIRIGREIKWIGSHLPEDANLLVALWWVGLLRSKVVCLSPPPKPNMWPPVVVVLNFYGWGKL